MKKATVQTFENNMDWNWADETTINVNVERFTDEIVQQAALHGLKQKLSDCYAGATTVREAKERFQATLDTLLKGDWNSKRMTTGGLWVEALARAANVTMEVALEKWKGLDEETIKDVKKSPAVKQAKAEIELERAKKKAEGSELDLSDF